MASNLRLQDQPVYIAAPGKIGWCLTEGVITCTPITTESPGFPFPKIHYGGTRVTLTGLQATESFALTDAERLALAVLAGDRQAAIVLADAVREQYLEGTR